MEALEVAASVLQVAAVGLALAQLLHGLCDEASSTRQQVKELASVVKSTSSVFEDLGKVFQDEGNTAMPIISHNAISTVKDIIDKCTATFEELEQMIADTEQSPLGLIKSPFKASRVKVYQLGLWEMRGNLQCMMQVIVYARMKVKAQTCSMFSDSEQRNLLKSLIREQVMATEEYRQAIANAKFSNDNGVLSRAATPGYSRPSSDGPSMRADSESEPKSDVDGFVRMWTTLYC